MNKKLYIKEIKGKGRGVFCKQRINKNDEFEICPLLVFPAEDHDTLIESHLVDYFFNFNKKERTLALAMGFGSLYNHAMYCNAAYLLDRENKSIIFYAIEDIPPNTEICINYAGERGKEFKEWFESRNLNYTN